MQMSYLGQLSPRVICQYQQMSDSPHLQSSIVASVKAEMEEPRLTASVRNSLGDYAALGLANHELLRSQIAVLRKSLAESERSWKAAGFGDINNPIATSIQCKSN